MNAGSANQSALPTWPAPRYLVATSTRVVGRFVEAARGDRALGLWIVRRPGDGRARGDVVSVGLARERERVEDEDEASTLVIPAEFISSALLGTLLAGDDAPYVVLHDAQDTLHWLSDLDILPTRFGSTGIAATLLSEGTSRGVPDLETVVERALEHSLPQDDLALRGEIDDAPARVASLADACLAAMARMTPMLRRRDLTRVYDLECRVLPAVVAMERAGVALDAERFQSIADGWVEERSRTEEPSRISRLDKLISTYGHWARDFVDEDGRIRCSLHPLATDSGRFSCSDPNLQQVPSSRTAPGLRACFVPAPGFRFVVADYAQIELRVAAHLAPDDVLRQVFVDAGDPHRTTAATITGKAVADIDDHERKLAKAVNFGFLFGMGARRFQSYAHDGYGVDLDDAAARRAREAFFATFPGISRWHERVSALRRRAQHEAVVVKTALGRRKRFEAGAFSFNAALNIPVQGTAADGFKLAMVELHHALADIGGQGVLCVHDEYIAEVPAEHASEAKAMIEALMIQGMGQVVPNVPIEVDAAIADHWD